MDTIEMDNDWIVLSFVLNFWCGDFSNKRAHVLKRGKQDG